MSNWNQNSFLGQSQTPQDVVVNSLTALNLEPNENVITDENGTLITSAMTGATGVSEQTLQEVYDTSVLDPTIITTETMSLYSSISNSASVLFIKDTTGGLASISMNGSGRITSKGLRLNGSTQDSLIIPNLTPSQLDTLAINTSNPSGLVAVNSGSKTIDTLDSSGNWFRGQRSIIGNPCSSMRFNLSTLSENGITRLYKFFAPHDSMINEIRLMLVAYGGDINLCIYDATTGDKVGSDTGNMANTFTPPEIVNLPLSTPAELKNGRSYWLAITYQNNLGDSFQLGFVADGGTGSGEIGYNSNLFANGINTDYTAGFPATLPALDDLVPFNRLWFQLTGNFVG
jgi:hypothetical protein